MTQARLKVLINAVSAKSGEAATYITNLANSLADGDIEWIVIVPPNCAA